MCDEMTREALKHHLLQTPDQRHQRIELYGEELPLEPPLSILTRQRNRLSPPASSIGRLEIQSFRMVRDGAVAVSAPGKVLLAGGYLVLDRAHTGLVFGLDARIHVLVQDIPTSNGIVINQFTAHSPQFLEAVWDYGYRLTERNGGIEVTQLRM